MALGTMLRLVLSMLLLASVVTDSQTQTPLLEAASAPKIGIIKKPLSDGCGCTLQLPEDYRKHNKRAVFLSDFGDTIQMNIDGKDVRLKMVSESPPSRKEKVSSHRKEIYRAGKDKVGIDYVVTNVCPPKDEGCEVTGYSATITVIRGRQSQQVKTLGICGC